MPRFTRELQPPSRRRPADASRKAIALSELCTIRRLPEAVIDEIDAPLTEMLRAAEIRARAMAALRLARCDWAPRAAVRALAFDAFEVSEPILEHSTRLDEQNLQALAGLGAAQRQALARRRSVSRALADRLSRYREAGCLAALARNDGADLGPGCASDFAEIARSDAALRDALAARSEYDSDFAAALFACADATVQAIIARACPEISPERLGSVTTTPGEALAEPLDTVQDKLAGALADSGALTAADALRATQNGRSDIADHAIARLTGMSPADWRQALRRSPVRATFLAARAMAMSPDDALAFFAALCALGRAHALPPETALRAASSLYAQYPRDEARRALHRMGADGSIG